MRAELARQPASRASGPSRRGSSGRGPASRTRAALVREVAIEVVDRVAPGDDVHAQARPLRAGSRRGDRRGAAASSSRREKLNSSSRRRRSRNRARSWISTKISGPSPPGFLPAPDLARRSRDRIRPVSRQPPTSTPCGRCPAIRASSPAWGWSSGVPSRTKKRAPGDAVGSGRGGYWAARPSRSAADTPRRRLVVLADDQDVVAPQAAEQGRRSGSLIAIASPSQAWTDRGDARPGRGLDPLAQHGVARQVGRGVALEDDRRPRQHRLPRPGQLVDPLEIRLAALVGAARRPGRSGCPRAAPLASL